MLKVPKKWYRGLIWCYGWAWLLSAAFMMGYIFMTAWHTPGHCCTVNVNAYGEMMAEVFIFVSGAIAFVVALVWDVVDIRKTHQEEDET